MAKKKPKNGRRATSRPGEPVTPKGTTKKKDPGGFVSPGFKSEGFQAGKRKTKTGPPPSVRARDEKRAKQSPPEKYAGKKKPGPPGWATKPIPPSWLKPRPKPRPKPKPKPRPEPRPPKYPKPPPGWKPKPLPKGPLPGGQPKPRKPKKPMGKGAVGGGRK